MWNVLIIFSKLNDTDEQLDHYFQKRLPSRITQQQLLLFEEENSMFAEHREQEVTKIVKSIVDLNDIFKSLMGMVQEQGTVLDCIDYNVEQMQTKLTEGFKSLLVMYCMSALASITVLMMVLLVLTKS